MGAQGPRISSCVQEVLIAHTAHAFATRTPPRTRSSRPPLQMAVTDAKPSAPHIQAGLLQHADVHPDTRRVSLNQVEENTTIAKKAQVQEVQRHVGDPGPGEGRWELRLAPPPALRPAPQPACRAALHTPGEQLANVCADAVLPKELSARADENTSTAKPQHTAIQPAKTQSHGVPNTGHTALVIPSLVWDQ